VEQDDKQAVIWYRKAAEQGDAEAQNNLAVMYANGKGTIQDKEQAVFWFHKAADQGEAMAQLNLGRMYFNGEGVQQDVIQAYMWTDLAAEQALEGAVNAQNNLIKALTVLQIKEGKKLAHEWISTHNLQAAQ
jgi:TPR repeat protein